MANTGSAMARSPSNPQLVVKPQDLVVLLRLALDQGPAPTYAALGSELGITASEIHAAVNPNDANVVLLERAAEQISRPDAGLGGAGGGG